MPTLARHQHLFVTGGAGFIGSHLVDAWIAGGGSATVLDDLSAGRPEHLAAAMASGRVRFVQGSVLDERRVDELVAASDGVAHLAAVVGVERVLDAPARTLEVGTRGGEHVVAAAARHGRPLLVASSSEVYGCSDRPAFHEDDALAIGSPERPRWTYAVSKLHTETAALAMARETGQAAVVARLFNTSGPRQGVASGMVLPRFVGAALAGEPLVVHGDGTQRRVFCHVADAVDALVRLLTTSAASGRVVNVGGAEEISIGALAERVVARFGSSSMVQRRAHAETRRAREEDTPRRVPDLGRVKTLTGWAPARTLDELLADLSRHLAGR